ncbi:hypothetical protein HU200_053125 [Digitaria exilis]|uniref:Uncharacterized protein n=1 Tax=Digitaria exilis TaxID=1010633 RepID=A0A835AMW1_9POAL|nr:hypothetical protein HU200_053125 [Digitaria exilis]
MLPVLASGALRAQKRVFQKAKKAKQIDLERERERGQRRGGRASEPAAAAMADWGPGDRGDGAVRAAHAGAALHAAGAGAGGGVRQHAHQPHRHHRPRHPLLRPHHHLPHRHRHPHLRRLALPSRREPREIGNSGYTAAVRPPPACVGRNEIRVSLASSSLSCL